MLSTHGSTVRNVLDKPLTNIFQAIPEELNQELVDRLIEQDSFRVERIVSRGQASPTEFWYDQDEHEWVVVLSGQALIQLDGKNEPIHLLPGDTLHLPARTKHRVESTDPLQPTIWLAIFWPEV